MLPAVLAALLVALAGASLLVRRWQRSLETEPVALTADPEPAPRVLAAAVAPVPTISGPLPPRPVPAPDVGRESVTAADPLDALDRLLAELESATVRIDGADELDEGAVAELETLAARFEAAAETFASR